MLDEAKLALDELIRKSRVHLYKPMQIAEILYYHRLGLAQFEPDDLESYRNASKRWRDAVSMRLVGRVSTSSQKYQDNLFDGNAMPPRHLRVLADYNRVHQGVVENYIYHRFQQRLQDVLDAYSYLQDSSVQQFSLGNFLAFYEFRPGLKRSIDKAYEIVVYALFSTLVQELKARVSLTLDNPSPDILADFDKFVAYVLGLQGGQATISVEAELFRGGVTNAADRGLDIITNYGPVVQVKHLSLSVQMATNIAENTAVKDVVIVCKTAEAEIIDSLLKQIGLGIRGIITQDDLETWYELCQRKYEIRMGARLLRNLQWEFEQEFPMLRELQYFLLERGYRADLLVTPFTIVSQLPYRD